ncbi:hypothetical protein PFISCL1PPCAC_20902, partial [Pristionchus fissidentatus]
KNRVTGWWTLLSETGNFLQLTPRKLDDSTSACTVINQHNLIPSTKVKFDMVGFVTVIAEDRSQQVDLVVSAFKNYLCLHELTHLDAAFLV